MLLLIIQKVLKWLEKTKTFIIADKLEVPKHLSDCVIQLHPSLMTLCGFVIGGSCLVNGQKLWTCLPSTQTAATSVGLSQKNLENFSKQGAVSVQVFDTLNTEIPFADEVILRTT